MFRNRRAQLLQKREIRVQELHDVIYSAHGLNRGTISSDDGRTSFRSVLHSRSNLVLVE